MPSQAKTVYVLTLVMLAGCAGTPTPPPGTGDASLPEPVDPINPETKQEPRPSSGPEEMPASGSEGIPESAIPVVSVSNVCFLVHHQLADLPPQSALVYRVWGQRYSTTNSSRTALLLVPGGGADHTQFAGHVDFSVARNLARHATVYTFDGLGKGHSRPADRGFGWTDINHVSILAEIAQQIRVGTYRITDSHSCDNAVAANASPAPLVVGIGESLGAFQAVNAAQRYGAFDAAVMGDVAASGLNPAWIGYLAQSAPTANVDGYPTFPIRELCEPMMVYEPGLQPGFEDECDRQAAHNAASGEAHDIVVADGSFLALMRQLPQGFPVLLTYADHSDAFRPQDGGPEADPGLWAQFCPQCVVETVTLEDTGHVIMWHKSMPVWTDHIANWLERQDLLA